MNLVLMTVLLLRLLVFLCFLVSLCFFAIVRQVTIQLRRSPRISNSLWFSLILLSFSRIRLVLHGLALSWAKVKGRQFSLQRVVAMLLLAGKASIITLQVSGVRSASLGLLRSDKGLEVLSLILGSKSLNLSWEIIVEEPTEQELLVDIGSCLAAILPGRVELISLEMSQDLVLQRFVKALCVVTL